MCTVQVSLTHFWHFRALLGAPKMPLFDQLKSFWYPKKSKNSVYRVQNAPTKCINLHLVPKLDILGHLMAFSGALGVILGQLGARKGFVLLINGCLGAPEGFQWAKKWASDGNLVNIGQLDHCVVFGTKSGAIHAF